jgi:hypothetical protein
MKNYDVANQRGTMLARVTVGTAGVTKVVAATIAAAAAAPNQPTGDAVELPPAGGVYEKSDFLVTNLPQDGPFADNKQFCYWGLDSNDKVLEIGDPVTFAAVPNPCTKTVDARNCIWLTYAEPDLPALSTYGETAEAGSPYAPAGVRVPGTAKTVRVQAAGGPWAHDPAPARETGPDGITGSEQDLARADIYKDAGNAKLHADTIQGQSLKLNLLVGLREYQPAGEGTTEIPVGSDATFDVIPGGGMAQPYRLRLAMHDGFQWSNNHGTVNATITFTE